MMQGIQFVTTVKGCSVAVTIDLQNLGRLWEVFFSVLTARLRENEPRETLASMKKRLRRRGKLSS